MNRICLPVLLIFMILAVAGCNTIVKDPQVAIQKTSITGIDNSGVEFEFLVDVTNPNSFDVSLLGYSYDLQLLSIPFSNGNSQAEVNFPSGVATELRVPLKIKFADVIELLKLHPELEQIPYRLNARLRLRTPLGERQIPVDKNDVFQLPEMYRTGNLFRRLLLLPRNDR